MTDLSVAQVRALLRAGTEARVAVGRAGDGVDTRTQLELREAHARARDAIHVPLDVDGLVAALAARGLGATVVRSAAADRSQYLRRPDLGRVLAPETRLPAADPEPGVVRVAVVIADGLSTRAVTDHAAEVAGALARGLTDRPGWRLLTPVVVTQARVAIGDEIGSALGADAVVVLVGERPGLSVSDSLGAYLTWGPRPGRRDSERNCVSNIRAPGGLDPRHAALHLLGLLDGARQLGVSGVALKASGGIAPITP